MYSPFRKRCTDTIANMSTAMMRVNEKRNDPSVAITDPLITSIARDDPMMRPRMISRVGYFRARYIPTNGIMLAMIRIFSSSELTCTHFLHPDEKSDVSTPISTVSAVIPW